MLPSQAQVPRSDIIDVSRLGAAKIRTYGAGKIRDIPHMARLEADVVAGIELAAMVFPFKVNDHVLDNLVDWDCAPDDPMFRLVFPHPDMLGDEADRLRRFLAGQPSSDELQREILAIRARLNPHSSNQLANRPSFEGEYLSGVQHKYAETVLFFPKQGQTCHSYCSFCFRWPQFVQSGAPRFESDDAQLLHRYLARNEAVSDLLITGGDPLVMNARRLRNYLDPLRGPEFSHIRNIRFGTKALTFWPRRFLDDADAEDLFGLIADLRDSGKHVAIMAHLNHWREMTPEPFQAAVAKLRYAGAVIRAQAPLLRHINDDPRVWSRNWTDQVRYGIQPYYMFVERDTGASHYFGVPLVRVLDIYREATASISGLARSVRGPIMSATPGKVQILGSLIEGGRRRFLLTFLQARRKDWLHRPFTATWDANATWLDDLRPADAANDFFFQDELDHLLQQSSTAFGQGEAHA